MRLAISTRRLNPLDARQHMVENAQGLGLRVVGRKPRKYLGISVTDQLPMLDVGLTDVVQEQVPWVVCRQDKYAWGCAFAPVVEQNDVKAQCTRQSRESRIVTLTPPPDLSSQLLAGHHFWELPFRVSLFRNDLGTQFPQFARGASHILHAQSQSNGQELTISPSSAL